MKTLRIAAGCGMLLSALLMAGCSSHYVMATKKGQMILTQGKPEIDSDTGLLGYTDETGQHKLINSDEISGIIER